MICLHFPEGKFCLWPCALEADETLRLLPPLSFDEQLPLISFGDREFNHLTPDDLLALAWQYKFVLVRADLN